MTEPKHNPLVAARRLAPGESVLLHLGTGAYHGLNEEGSMIWPLLDGTRTVDEIVEELHGAITDPPADLRERVTEFVAALRQRDLVH